MGRNQLIVFLFIVCSAFTFGQDGSASSSTAPLKFGIQKQTYSYAADTGAADVYVITLAPVPAAYVAGMRFSFKASAANATTTPTLNVNGLGAKTIVKNGSAALAANDIKVGQIVDVEYDGTNFQMQSSLGNASSSSGTTINPTNGVPPVRSNATTFRDGLAADFVALFTSCSGIQYLGADGACHTASGSLPLTTKGDLFGFDSANARIPIGANGSILTADSAQTLGVKWAALPGSSGNVIYNNGGVLGGLHGVTADSSVDISSASSSRFSAVDSWGGSSSTSTTVHVFDTSPTWTGSIKVNTFSSFYGTMILGGTNGAGHPINIVSRIQNHNTGTIDELDNYYADMTNNASDTSVVTLSTQYFALSGNFTGGGSNTYANHAGFRYGRQVWNSPTVATVEQAFVGDMPVAEKSSSNNVSEYYGLRIGGATKSTKYVAMAIGGGESYFTEAIEQSAQFSNVSNTNLTTGGILASSVYSMFRQSNFCNQAVVCSNVDSLITIANGAGSATAYGINTVADNGGNSAAALVVGGRFKGSNSGGATLTKSIGVSVLAPSNGATITDTSGVEIASLTAATQTNTPIAIKQIGANDINTFAGVIFWNGNKAFVTSDFTTAANTSLQNITGLTFTLPANTAENVAFTCSLPYSQGTAAAAVSFGISASVAPTQINASGEIFTSASVFAAGNLQGLATTTATAIVTGTPSATATVFNAVLRGFIENPSGAANTITIMVKTATSGDAVTVKRGGYCILGG